MARNLTTISVVFDGEVLRPDEPLDLEPNTRYVAILQAEDGNIEAGKENVWQMLKRFAGTVDAPADWASEHDHYLYGTPKRQDADPGNQS